MSGNEIPGRTREEQYASLLEGSRRAADLAAAADLTLIIEPLNTKVDHKGYYLNTAAEGLKLVKAVDNPHFRLLFDLYHEQTEVGDPTKLAVEAIPYTAVFHVADSPGRHDPGTGRMNYIQIYKAIAKAGYNGIICMEYLPQADQVASLIKSTDSMRAAIA
jgi:hydroxypyruvate isomerase